MRRNYFFSFWLFHRWWQTKALLFILHSKVWCFPNMLATCENEIRWLAWRAQFEIRIERLKRRFLKHPSRWRARDIYEGGICRVKKIHHEIKLMRKWFSSRWDGGCYRLPFAKMILDHEHLTLALLRSLWLVILFNLLNPYLMPHFFSRPRKRRWKNPIYKSVVVVLWLRRCFAGNAFKRSEFMKQRVNIKMS